MLTRDELRALVAETLEVAPETVGEDDNLLEFGMDSVRMIQLAGRLRRGGAEVTFAALAERPTIADWWRLLNAQEPAATTETNATEETSAASETDETRQTGHAEFDLALMQHAFWIGRGDGPEFGGVAAHFYHEFDGSGVDPARLERAVRALLARHGMLRAQFLPEGRQRIPPESSWRGLTVHDLRALAPSETESELARLRESLSHRLLDVERGEVFDVQLSLVDGERTRMHVNLDMLAADALSLRILLADLANLYAKPDDPLPDLTYDYRSYLSDRAQRKASARQAARQWWQERVPEVPGAPRLPVRRTTEPPRVTRRHRWLSPPEKATLYRAARQRQLTPAMTLAAAFAEVLAAWSEQPRFLLNVPFFDREPLHPDVFRLVGDFSGSLLLDIDASEPVPFAERAARVQDRLREDAAHSGYSGVEVLRDLSRANDGERVLAPVVYTSALNLGELFPPETRAVFGDPVWIISQGPQVWLDAQVTELDGGLLVNWDAREEIFPPGVLDAMFGAYLGLLDRLLASDEAWDEPVGALLPESQTAVRERVNVAAGPRPDRLLHAGFFDWADRAPERVALLDDGHEYTYGELSLRARKIAGALRGKGVCAGDLVAVTVPKGLDQVVAVLAVLACGAGYVPVGVDQPAARRERIYHIAGVRLVVTDEPGGDVTAVSPQAEADPVDVELNLSAESVAYVIFTSGSTGEPKGVLVPHRAVVNTLDAVNEQFGIGADDRTIALSALDFDLSAYDLFAFLSVGGSVVLIDEASRRDAQRWAGLIRDRAVTVVSCVPALLDMLLTAGVAEGLGSTLRLVMLGGDWVGVELPGRLRALVPGCRFAGLGGMTEAAIHSTVQEVHDVPEDWRAVPYGAPLRNVRCRVVDARGRDCPDWVTGELWVGGAGVALGYLGDAERTAEKFVEHDGTRWYRTGDLARYWPDGTLEFLGRADHQVKIRGHRIELGEVEAVLTAHPAVTHAVVVVVGDRARRLAALVTPGDVEPGEIRAWAAERLPGYMVPEHVVARDEPPITRNGKLDRRFVRRLFDGAAEPEVVEPPCGAVEQAVAAVWCELLGVPAVGRNQSFFALGGDSLLATRLMIRLHETGVHGAELTRLFEVPVLAGFAQGLRLGEDEPAPLLRTDPEHRYEPFPLTEVQRAYWLGRSDGLALGGVPTIFRLDFDGVGVEAARLGEAVNRLVARHDMMRAIVEDDGRQRVLPEVPPVTVEMREAGEPDAKFLHGWTSEPGRWPLFDVRGVRYGHDRVRLTVSLDALVFDALSVQILIGELARLYVDPAAELPELGLSFRDYVIGASPGAKETAETYWRARLAELPPGPQLPLAADPATVRPRFRRREARVGAAEWQRIRERAREVGLTPSAVLLECYARVLSRWSGRPDLTVNLTLFDRRPVHPGLDHVLGDFTSLLPLEYRPAEEWLESARRVQSRLAADLTHRAVSSIWVQRELARATDAPATVFPVVFTSTLGLGREPFSQLPQGFPEWVGGASQTPQVWLDHQLFEHDGGLVLVWDAVEELFPPGLLDAMFAAYRELLEWLADADWAQRPPDLLPERQGRVRDQVNDTGAPGVTAAPGASTGGDGLTTSGRVLHEAFFARAVAEPDRPALLGAGFEVTYGELADRAVRVAGWLRQQGIRPGDAVAVTLPKGPDQIVAVLGVLAAGAVYVPIGVDQPDARRRRMHTAAGVSLVLDQLPAADPVEPLFVHGPAYVIFTSGSTGEPKGVEVSHRAAVNTIEDINERFAVSEQDRVLAVSALDFDLSVYDIFGMLSAGGALVLIAEDERRDARAWAELAREHGVTLWNSVPALLDMLLSAGEPVPPSLRLALVSGDWVGLDLRARLGRRLVALGGATEAAIWSNAFEVSEVDPGWSSIPYGFPLRNQRYRVVDAAGRDCPDWVPGELWIGGTGVATGYRGDPELTAAKFVEHDGIRWYRTGDLGRYWPDGTLEFLGRADHQVKIRGHRIELGEIETTLTEHPALGHAVVVAEEDLAAFVVPAPLPATGAGSVIGDPGAEDTSAGAALTEALLRRLLDTQDEIAEEHQAAVRTWRAWLAERPESPLPEVPAEYAGRLPELAAILRGDLDPAALLDDPILAPDAQFLAHRAVTGVLGEIANRVAGPVRIAEIGARGGRAAATLLSGLTPAHYTLIDTSEGLLRSARERLAGVPHDVRYHHTTGPLLPDELRHDFDAVLAVGALHRDPASLRLAAALLAPGGSLFAVESERATPMSVLTLPLLGKTDLLTGERWRDSMAAHGFTNVTVHRRPASLLLLEATRPNVNGVDPIQIHAWLAERLPAQMIPGRIAVGFALPLTANGKVDRARVPHLLARTTADVPMGAPPEGPIEERVAAVWAEVLGVTAVSRDAGFFALGGDSLLATRVISRLRNQGLHAQVGRLFATPVLADFASTVDEGDGTIQVVRPDPQHRHDPFPLTEVQRAYWLGRREDFALGGVSAHCFFEFDGAGVDLTRLERAWNRLIERHEMLRAVIDDDGTQRILREVPRLEIPVEHVASAEAASERLRQAMAQQVLDLTRWPLFDVRAVRYGDRVRLGISLDNIILDGLSMLVVLAELAAFYRDPDLILPEIGVSFRDSVVRDTRISEPSDRDTAERYWRARLPELAPGPQLPLATDPGALTRPRFTRREFRLSPARWSALRDAARAHGLTPSMVLLTCYAQVLSRWSAQPEVTVNVTLFDRPDAHPDINRVLGDFTSLLPVEHRPVAGEGWLAAARRLQARFGEDLEHRAVSSIWVARQRGDTLPVVFTSALGLTGDLMLDGFPELIGGVSQTPQVWLDHQVLAHDGGLLLVWDAVEQLFPAGVLDAMFTAYQDLLRGLLDADWSRYSADLLPEAQRRVREQVNDTGSTGGGGRATGGRVLHEAFFARASAEPDRVALVGTGFEIGYGELAGKACRIAGWLRTQGVRPGDAVAISLPKAPDQIAAVLGVLAAGGVYVPIGVDQPAARRHRIQTLAAVRLTIDDVHEALQADAVEPVFPDGSAYVIFTSGSTGEPKGVEVSHRAAVNTIEDINERFAVSEKDKVLAVSALDFDLSVYDIFGLLSAGGTVVLPTEDERRDVRAWARLADRHGITLWNSVPALLDLFLATTDVRLRLALVSGDWVGLDLASRLNGRLVALGGATEAAIWSNAIEVPEVDPSWSSIPYGFPLRNQRYRVVDALGRDCPDWVPGELWIGGAGVADGYRGDPELTAAKFVEYDGIRWYRTGDVGRYWPDGTLEFLGRADHQVKIRGHRIELGEIEAALTAHPDITRAVAVAAGERGNRRLHAFVHPVEPPGLRDFLADRLPGYAIPGRVTAVPDFPLTANGKLDRGELARWAGDDPVTLDRQPPASGTEEQLAALWAELLGLSTVGRHDEFLDLGGDSLLVMRLATRLRESFGLDVPLRDLLRGCTIATLAAAITEHEEGDV